MTNYIQFAAQSWTQIDWSDPNNPIDVGSFFHFSKTNEEALTFAATLPVAAPGVLIGYKPDAPYQDPVPFYVEMNKDIILDVLNNTNTYITGHVQFTLETPRHGLFGWPSNDGEHFGSAPPGGARPRLQDPVANFAAFVLAQLFRLGYKDEGTDLEAIYNAYLEGKVTPDYMILKTEAVIDAIHLLG